MVKEGREGTVAIRGMRERERARERGLFFNVFLFNTNIGDNTRRCAPWIPPSQECHLDLG